MNKTRPALLLLLTTTLSAQAAPDYLPLAKGNQWTYSSNLAREVVIRVEAMEDVEGVECALVQTKFDGKMFAEEWLAVREGALRSYQVRNQQGTITFGKPAVYLPLPVKNGARWTSSTRDFDGNEVKGSYSVESPVSVLVLGKECQAIKVSGTVTSSKGPMQVAAWYQDGVGIVRQEWEQGGQHMTFELTGVKLAPRAAPRRDGPAPVVPRRDAPAPEPRAGGVDCECGAKIAAGKKFCGECGAKAPQPKPVATVCPKCSEKVAAGVKFCGECGTPVGKGAPADPDAPPARTVDGDGKPRNPLARPPAQNPLVRPPAQKPQLERYESEDGKVVLFRPPGWNVKVGDFFGEETYSVTVMNPEETAGVMMIAAPTANAQPKLESSVDFANLVLSGLGKQIPGFEVDKMTSSPDRARTSVEVRYEEKGNPMRGHFYFFWTPRTSSFLGFGAAEKDFEAMRPTLITMTANLAYAPEGARKVLDEGRRRAAQAPAAVARGAAVQTGSPVQMIQQAKRQQVPREALQPTTLADGSGTIGLPPGWQVEAGNGQYIAFSDPKRREEVFSTRSNIYTPDQAGLGMDQAVTATGGIVSPVLSPAQTLVLLMEKHQVGRQFQILAGNTVAELDPAIDQQLRQTAMRNGMQVVSHLLLAEFTLVSTGERCRGIFSITTMASSMGNVWSVMSAGSWAPADQYAQKLPLFLGIADSYAMDQNWARQTQQQKNADLAQSQANLRKSISGLSGHYEKLNEAWHDRQKSNDYTAWARSQTTLGNGTWIAEREGGEVVTTYSSWGATDEQGRQAEGQPWNTTNFRGESPWTGEQLREVNTRADYEKYVLRR